MLQAAFEAVYTRSKTIATFFSPVFERDRQLLPSTFTRGRSDFWCKYAVVERGIRKRWPVGLRDQSPRSQSGRLWRAKPPVLAERAPVGRLGCRSRPRACTPPHAESVRAGWLRALPERSGVAEPKGLTCERGRS